MTTDLFDTIQNLLPPFKKIVRETRCGNEKGGIGNNICFHVQETRQDEGR
jgi:hypothetical protein